jgi:hypothetical protein
LLRVKFHPKRHCAGIDANTLEIRSIEVTDNSVGDAPMLPQLLGQIPPDGSIASVSADGAYDTKACHTVINEGGAQAVIPPRKRGKAWRATLKGALARNEALKACCRRVGDVDGFKLLIWCLCLGLGVQAEHSGCDVCKQGG